MNRPPNLLFVFSDQHRFCDLGCAGNPDVHTPFMDWLAREGTRFTHAISNCPLCVPARGSILTGRHPLSHRAVSNDLPLPQSERGIAQVYREAGYQTSYIGKWHLGGIPRDKFIEPEMRFGFDTWAAWECHHDYFNGRYHTNDGTAIRIDGYEPDFQTDLAIRYCRRHRDEPFCLFLSWGPPHSPYDTAPTLFKDLYDPRKLTLRPNGEEGHREDLAGYYAHISALDANLGKLMDALVELGIADNTILVYTSDHGDMLGSHGQVRKERPWEESIRVPFLVGWPGMVPAGVTCDALLGIVDFAPSLLSLCGLPVPDGVQGIDLSPAMLGKPVPEPDSVLLGIPLPGGEGFHKGVREWRGIRTRRHTYARFQDGSPWVLYDNQDDPYQLQNLANDSAHSDLCDELESQLWGWLDRVGDRFLPGLDHIRELGLADLWNVSEKQFGKKRPRWA